MYDSHPVLYGRHLVGVVGIQYVFYFIYFFISMYDTHTLQTWLENKRGGGGGGEGV